MSFFKSHPLELPNLLTTYIMSFMVTYLTGVWELSLTKAAAIMNLFSGMVAIVPMGMKLIVDDFLGNYPMALFSSLAFAAGYVVLAMSTPPVLCWATGTCSAFEPECIGHVQKTLFYTALVLLALGVSSHVTSIAAFIDEQPQLLPPPEISHQSPSTSDLINEQFQAAIKRQLRLRASEISDQSPPASEISEQLLPAASEISSDDHEQQLTPESDRDEDNSSRCLGICCKIFTVVLTLLLAIAGVVAVVAIDYISSWAIKFGIAAILAVVSTISFLTGSGTCASYRPVKAQGIALSCEETIRLLRIIPICIFFVLIGVVSSIGNTYFIEQATDMNHYIGSLRVSVLVLPFLKELFKRKGPISKMCRDHRFPEAEVAASMIYAILCCITAAKVETRRLGVVKSQGVMDEPEEIIPMTMFWLVPQYVLLGWAESFSEKGIARFVTREVLSYEHPFDDYEKLLQDENKTKLKLYIECFVQAVNGMGIIGGVLSVYVVGEISASGGGTNWFQYTINRSRLDNYYWTLSAMLAVNLPLYLLGSCLYWACTFTS